MSNFCQEVVHLRKTQMEKKCLDWNQAHAFLSSVGGLPHSLTNSYFFNQSDLRSLLCRCLDVRQTCTSSNSQLEQLCIRLLCPELGALESRLASGILRDEKRNQIQQSLYSKDFLNGPESDIGLTDLDTPSGFFNTGKANFTT